MVVVVVMVGIELVRGRGKPQILRRISQTKGKVDWTLESLRG